MLNNLIKKITKNPYIMGFVWVLALFVFAGLITTMLTAASTILNIIGIGVIFFMIYFFVLNMKYLYVTADNGNSKETTKTDKENIVI